MSTMTSLERVFTTMGHKEPDRVPLFLLLTMHGARELGMSIKEYFSKAANVSRGQMILREKYGSDCIYTFFHAALEVEAYGGEVLYFDDSPPNAGEPFIKNIDQIDKMTLPDIRNSSCLLKALDAIGDLKKQVKNQAPVIGVVMSPYSVPVMQMGFDKYLELMYFIPDKFNILMKKNMAFTAAWANAQLEAGADAICYFDPLASPTIIEREQYLRTGFQIAKETISKINGPTATHLASGRTVPVIKDLIETGTMIVGASALDDLSEVKEIAGKKLTVMGNLDGIEMHRWKPGDAEKKVKEAIRQCAAGGGFILSDNHGEIPWQTSEDVLFEIAEAVRRFGRYPLDWMEDNE